MANSLSLSTDRIRCMYAAVDENITPLPRQWSSKDKSSILGLSQNNLMIHYKGSLCFVGGGGVATNTERRIPSP